MAVAEADGYFVEVPVLHFAGGGAATIDVERQPIELGSAFTLEVWFRPDVVPQGTSAILTAYLDETPTEGAKNTRPLSLLLYDGMPAVFSETSRANTYVFGPSLRGKEWFHIAAVYQGGNMNVALYQPGKQASKYT